MDFEGRYCSIQSYILGEEFDYRSIIALKNYPSFLKNHIKQFCFAKKDLLFKNAKRIPPFLVNNICLTYPYYLIMGGRIGFKDGLLWTNIQ